MALEQTAKLPRPLVNQRGNEASPPFRHFKQAEIFCKSISPPPNSDRPVLMAAWLDTPLGPMLTLADDCTLHLLEFTDRRGLERSMERRCQRFTITPGRTKITDQIEAEIADYFAGQLQQFQTPIELGGTPFQQKVWRALTAIAYGATCSYAELALMVGNPKGFRAVAGANGCNSLAIIVPCHRVINANGKLGGYAGGLVRKEWLLQHEQQHASARQNLPIIHP